MAVARTAVSKQHEWERATTRDGGEFVKEGKGKIAWKDWIFLLRMGLVQSGFFRLNWIVRKGKCAIVVERGWTGCPVEPQVETADDQFSVIQNLYDLCKEMNLFPTGATGVQDKPTSVYDFYQRFVKGKKAVKGSGEGVTGLPSRAEKCVCTFNGGLGEPHSWVTHDCGLDSLEAVFGFMK
jgi:hypothetical protein